MDKEMLALLAKQYQDAGLEFKPEFLQAKSETANFGTDYQDGDPVVPITSLMATGTSPISLAKTNPKAKIYFEADPQKDYAKTVLTQTQAGVQPMSYEEFLPMHQQGAKVYADRSNQFWERDSQMAAVTTFDWKQLGMMDIDWDSNYSRIYSDPKFQNGKRLRTDSQVLDNNGFYISADNIKKPIAEYQMLNSLGNYSRQDEKGKNYMLIEDQDENGMPAWREVPTDASVKGSLIRSLNGPQKMKQGNLSTFYDATVNTMVDMVAGSAGSIAEVVGSLFGEDNMLQDWGNRTMNSVNAYKGQAGLNQEEKRGFWNPQTLGSIAGNLIPMLAGGWIFNTAAKGAAAAGASQATLKGIGMGSKALNWGYFGGAYAAHAMNQEMKEMGFSIEERRLMYPFVLAAGLGTEAMFGQMGAKGWMDTFNAPQEGLHAINNAMGDALRKTGLKPGMLNETTAKTVAKEAAEAFAAFTGRSFKESKEAWMAKGLPKPVASIFAVPKQLWETGVSAGKGVPGLIGKGWDKFQDFTRVLPDDGVLRTKLKIAVNSGVEEGIEEVVQGSAENALKVFTDYMNEGTLNEDGSQRKTGNGMFGVIHNGESALGAWINRTLEESTNNFLGGFISGPGVAAFRSNPIKHLTKDPYIDLVQQMGEDQAANFIRQKMTAERWGNDELSVDGQIMTPALRASGVKSQLDVVIEAAEAQVRRIGASMNMLGIKPSEAKQYKDRIDAIGGPDILSSAVKAQMEIDDLLVRTQDIEKQIQDAQIAGADTTALQQEMATTKAEMQKYQEYVNDVNSGKIGAREKIVDALNYYNYKTATEGKANGELSDEAFKKGLEKAKLIKEYTPELEGRMKALDEMSTAIKGKIANKMSVAPCFFSFFL